MLMRCMPLVLVVVSKVGSVCYKVISYFARHNTAANLILVLMVVFGLLAINKIRSQFFPDVVIAWLSLCSFNAALQFSSDDMVGSSRVVAARSGNGLGSTRR